MGGQTPIFSLRYPYQSETVDATHFKNLADDIDAALDLIDARSSLVLNKPALRIRQSINQTGITSATLAFVPFDTAEYNPNGWWNAGAPTLVALPAGIYHVTCTGSNLTGTLTGYDERDMEFQINSTLYSRISVAVPTSGDTSFTHHSVVYTATPQNLRVGWQWHGTAAGSGTLQNSDLRIRQIRDL